MVSSESSHFGSCVLWWEHIRFLYNTPQEEKGHSNLLQFLAIAVGFADPFHVTL